MSQKRSLDDSASPRQIFARLADPRGMKREQKEADSEEGSDPASKTPRVAVEQNMPLHLDPFDNFPPSVKNLCLLT